MKDSKRKNKTIPTPVLIKQSSAQKSQVCRSQTIYRTRKSKLTCNNSTEILIQQAARMESEALESFNLTKVAKST